MQISTTNIIKKVQPKIVTEIMKYTKLKVQIVVIDYY